MAGPRKRLRKSSAASVATCKRLLYKKPRLAGLLCGRSTAQVLLVEAQLSGLFCLREDASQVLRQLGDGT